MQRLGSSARIRETSYGPLPAGGLPRGCLPEEVEHPDKTVGPGRGGPPRSPAIGSDRPSASVAGQAIPRTGSAAPSRSGTVSVTRAQSSAVTTTVLEIRKPLIFLYIRSDYCGSCEYYMS